MSANLSKKLLTTCLLMFQLSILSPVFAKSGGGAIAGGGGNTLNGVLIEDYESLDPFEDLPELKVAKESLLSKLESLSPDFASELDEKLNERTWYILPVKFNELSAERTGLNFKTEQPAYQNEYEIFISRPQINEMESSKRITLYQHEFIMTLIRNKDESGHASVRRIMNILKKTNVSELDFVNKLYEHGFGAFTTRSEVLAIESLKSEYQESLKTYCSNRTKTNESKIDAILSKVQAMTKDSGQYSIQGMRKAYDLNVIILGDIIWQYQKGCHKSEM